MRILIFNWRSIKDQLAGGAELATIEYAKRWSAKHNARITWISAPYNNKIKEEVIEGINFMYLGKPLERDNTFKMIIYFPLFYFLCFYVYLTKYKGKIDLVIDQSHGFPFLTPLYVKEKVILYIHEYAGNLWDKMFSFPVSFFGKNLEKFILRFYKNITTVTVSQGTKKELLDLFFDEKKVYVVESSPKLLPLKAPKSKSEKFTLLFLNRVVRMKGPERAINIFKIVSKSDPDSKLIIAGKYDLEYKKELDNLIKKLNLRNIEFKGFVSEEEKISLLQKSHVFINTSYKEGWGIVNIEANTQGTPVVAFNVEGCRESVKEGVSGFLAHTEMEFAEKVLKLKELNLEKSSIEYSKKFNYEEKSEEFWNIINER